MSLATADERDVAAVLSTTIGKVDAQLEWILPSTYHTVSIHKDLPNAMANPSTTRAATRNAERLQRRRYSLQNVI